MCPLCLTLSTINLSMDWWSAVSSTSSDPSNSPPYPLSILEQASTSVPLSAGPSPHENG